MAKDDDKKTEMKEQAVKEETPEQEDYKERMLRLAAEFDNYKKRVRSDVDNAKMIGKAELMKGLLPVLDEFELALMSSHHDEEHEVMKGIEMVYSNFLHTLKKEGLSEMKAAGMYDPYKHEIIMTREDGKRKAGTILEVTKKGYILNDMVLRPASVIIAKEKENKQ